ncbi:MAG: PDZ domain-containing protein [Deltaproteobacteria bacterium]|nr:MAG: PDZ domain-containing protein [Deltaproteobacteria bacterium]
MRPAPSPAAPPTDVRATDAARAPDKATLDARALADVMTADRRTRAPRAATADAAAAPAEVRPAAAADAHPGRAVVLSRAELDSALGDFAGLSAAIRGRFSAAGLVIEGVGDGSIFARAGLRAGDVVTSVDGVRLRSLDDAANLYARASTARALTAQIVRGGKPMALHVVVHQ